VSNGSAEKEVVEGDDVTDEEEEERQTGKENIEPEEKVSI